MESWGSERDSLVLISLILQTGSSHGDGSSGGKQSLENPQFEVILARFSLPSTSCEPDRRIDIDFGD